MAAKPGETQRRQSKTSVVPTPCSKIKESHLEKLMEQFQSPSCQEPGECSFVYFWGKRSKVLNQNKWKDWLIISTSDVGVTGRPGVSHCLYADFLYSHPYFLNLRVVGVGDLKLLCFSVSNVLITPLGEKSMTKDTVLHQCQLWMDSEWKIVSIWVHRNMDFPKFSLAMELCFNWQPLPMSQRFPLC